MYFRSLVRGPSMVLAGLLLAATISACSSAATASSSNATAPAPVATTAVSAVQGSTTGAQPTAPAALATATTVAKQSTTTLTSPTLAARPTQSSEPTASTGATSAVAKINLNTATAEQILTVPNAGNRMVREFQEYRPYTSILTFRQEIGKYVDAATVAAYEQYVYVPVDPNQSDSATLQQIPGVTADVAQSLIAARPYASNDAFLTKLAESLSAGQVAAAKAYLP